MATRAKADQKQAVPVERPFAHLRATPEELIRILADAPPFDAEAWCRGATPPTPEEQADLEDFLRELEEMRRYSVERLEERLAKLGK